MIFSLTHKTQGASLVRGKSQRVGYFYLCKFKYEMHQLILAWQESSNHKIAKLSSHQKKTDTIDNNFNIGQYLLQHKKMQMAPISRFFGSMSNKSFFEQVACVQPRTARELEWGGGSMKNKKMGGGGGFGGGYVKIGKLKIYYHGGYM